MTSTSLINRSSSFQITLTGEFDVFPRHSIMRTLIPIELSFCYVRCGCVSFSCISLSWDCLGTRCSGRTCFCIEGSGFCLKPVSHSKSCIVCLSGNFELTNPQSCCALYQQIFCCECFLTSECMEKGYVDPPMKPTNVASNVVPEELDGAYVLL